MEPPGEPKGAKMVSLDAPRTLQDDPDPPQDVQGVQNGAKMEDKWSQMQQNGPQIRPGSQNWAKVEASWKQNRVKTNKNLVKITSGNLHKD